MTIEGYAGAVSGKSGDKITLFLSGPASTVTLTVKRYAGSESASLTTAVAPQPVPPVNAWTGYGWTTSTTSTFTIPSTFPSGYYRVLDGASVVAGFVVRSSAPGTTSKVLLSVDMLTNQAYNSAGGKSLYDPARASIVSFNRPGGLPDARELPIHDWLAAQGRPVECCAAQDLGKPGFLNDYDCLIIAGHAEYWTREMFEQVTAFVAGGGNLVSLSGNTCYRQVRLEASGRRLVFYKYAGADPTRQALDASVAIAEPPVNRSQAALLGASFTYAAWGAQVAHPYQLRFPGHWAMAGVAATQTAPFLGYETDAAPYVEEDEGYPRTTGEEGTPPTLVLLGTADLRDANWQKPGAATMSVYRRNGTVFSAGSTDWVDTLTGQPQFPTDPSIIAITTNVLNRLSARIPADWEHVGHANGGRALTAVGNRLFLATTANRLWRRHPVAAEVPWREVGHADSVVALASDGDALYGLTATDQLWWRPAVEVDVPWNPMGAGAGGANTLACAGGLLYATDAAGTMHRRPASHAAGLPWRSLSLPPRSFTSLASFADILFGTTPDGRLMRTNQDHIAESTGWVDIHHCYFSIGLAAVGASLFVATSENKLWWLDLHGVRKP
ncbi:MAG: N,N-dimethylformamidase beta subunit family domain-containing protein [Propionicimonas sp.]